MFQKAALWAKVIAYAIQMIGQELGRQPRYLLNRTRSRISGSTPATDRDRNIVIIGASFAGYFAAQIIAKSLPPNSRYRLVVVEPNSHFQFSWLLPRFCVAQGHEHKALIPYGGWFDGLPDGTLRWVKDWVVDISRTHVRLQDGEEIPYEYLLIATGSGVEEGLPSRINATEKADGVERLREMQKGIETAKRVVIVGGGAAGVEVATDAKDLYPDKDIILVHSRSALMHRFGKGLQDAALEGAKRLGVEVILEERVVKEDQERGTVELRSGRIIECDKFINCTGQKPTSGVIAQLSPKAIASSGHIIVRPNLQIADNTFSNIYACGDVAETHTPNPNARAAARQAAVAADNILRCTRGREPSNEYSYSWADGFIKLTLGLHQSTTHLGDGKSEILMNSKKDPIDLMAKQAWWQMGAKGFDDNEPTPKAAV